MLVQRRNIRHGSTFTLPPKEVVKFCTSWGVLKPIKWITNIASLGGILFFTTEGNITGNKLLQLSQWVPTSTNSKNNTSKIKGNNYDGFFAKQKELGELLNIFEKADIDPKDFNTSKDGIIFNKIEDRAKARELLSFRISHEKTRGIKSNLKEGLRTLNELDALDQILFGINGLNPEKYSQGGVPNCQILAAIKGLSFTKENIQELKSLIEVTGYCLDKDNFYIDTVVHLNGEKIPVPFTELRQKMSPRDFSPTSSTDGALALPILAYAIEEAANKYDKIPHLLQSTSPILLTGKNYVSIATWSLDDRNLMEILQLAPDVPITVGSFIRKEDLNFETIRKEFRDKFDRKHPEYCPEKDAQFIGAMRERIIEIQGVTRNSDKSDLLSKAFPEKGNVFTVSVSGGLFPKSTGDGTQMPASSILANHQYAVKSCKKVGDKVEIILTDSHGREYEPQDLDSFRKNIASIVFDVKHAPILTSRSTASITLIFLTWLLLRKGMNVLNRRMYPDYMSFAEMGIARLRKKEIKDPKTTDTKSA